MTIFLSPGVYPREIDRSQVPTAFAPFVAAMVYQSDRGPLGRQFYFERDDFVKLNGKPDITRSYAGFCADHYFDDGKYMVGYRVPGVGARYATGHVTSTPVPSAPSTYDGTTLITGGGMEGNPASVGVPEVWDLVFSGPLVATQQIAMSINGNAISAVTYAITHNHTMRVLAFAIQSILDGIGNRGKVQIKPSAGALDDQLVLHIVAPVDNDDVPIPLVFTSMAVTGGTPPTFTAQASRKLFDIWAENPGAWGNKLAVGINNSGGAGTKARLTLTFSAALVASNSFSCAINGFPVGPVVYSGSTDTTMAAIAAAIQAVMVSNVGANSTAAVVPVPGTTGQIRKILVTAPDAETDITLDNAVVTLGVSQATCTVNTTTTRIAPTYRFLFNLYELPNLHTPVYTQEVNLRTDSDSLGNKLTMDYRVNESPYRAASVRVALNPLLANNSWQILSNIVPNGATLYAFLGGGANGATATSAEIISGWQEFADRADGDIRCMINAGYTAVEIQQAMVQIAQNRKDCLAILDHPDGMTATQTIDWRLNTLNVNSSWGCLDGPFCEVFDLQTNAKVWVPVSGMRAGILARIFNMGNPALSPAGLRRAKLNRVQNVRYKYREGERDLLSQNEVNYVIHQSGTHVFWEDNTLLRERSYLRLISVRMLMIQIAIMEMETLIAYNFEPNRPDTWFAMKQIMDSAMKLYKDIGMVDDFAVFCDANTNTPELIAQQVMRIVVQIIPSVPGKMIIADNVVNRHGTVLNETVPFIT